jgi:hypothetical protein
MILRVQKCEHEVEMKTLIGQADLWCFTFSRLMGEETWAGVCSRNISTNTGQYFPKLQEPSHVSSSQQYPR